MKHNYYIEDVGNGNEVWFVWETDEESTVTAISLHGARSLSHLLRGLGSERDEDLRV